MKKSMAFISIAFGAALAMPASAQLHVAQTSNPAPAIKNPMVAAPTLPDVAKVATKADAETFADAEFAFADADKSLNLTKAEFQALVKARADKAKDNAPNGATPATPATAAAQTTAPKSADAQFADIAGKAAQIDKATLVKARLAAFASADADSDGKLSATENIMFADLVAGKSTA